MQPESPLLIVVLAIGAVGLAGLLSLLRIRRQLTEALSFSLEFQNNVHALLEQKSRETYEWLTRNAVRMQHELGGTGLVTFRPPFANYVVNDYPVVLNGLAEIRKALSDDLLARGDQPAQYHALVDDALMRHQGIVLEKSRQNSVALRNPLTWLAVGTQVLLSAPLWVLASLGVLPRRLVSRVRSSSIFRVFSGITAAIGFLSAVVGLVSGWEQFLQIARKVVPGAF
jgi:hypothetical protein